MNEGALEHVKRLRIVRDSTPDPVLKTALRAVLKDHEDMSRLLKLPRGVSLLNFSIFGNRLAAQPVDTHTDEPTGRWFNVARFEPTEEAVFRIAIMKDTPVYAACLSEAPGSPRRMVAALASIRFRSEDSALLALHALGMELSRYEL